MGKRERPSGAHLHRSSSSDGVLLVNSDQKQTNTVLLAHLNVFLPTFSSMLLIRLYCLLYMLPFTSFFHLHKLRLCLAWRNISLWVVIVQMKITMLNLFLYSWKWVRSRETTMRPLDPPDTTNSCAKWHRILGLKSDFRSNFWWLRSVGFYHHQKYLDLTLVNSAVHPSRGSYLKLWNNMHMFSQNVAL